MDKRINIWNVLHDGEITAISGENTDTLTMFVSIPYLRRRLEPLGDSVVLILRQLKSVAYYNSKGQQLDLREEIDIAITEILQCKSESLPLTVELVYGDRLILDFDSIDIYLDTGQPLQYEQLEKTCHEYWTEWERKHQEASRKTST